jgi:hypothetical protein
MLDDHLEQEVKQAVQKEELLDRTSELNQVPNKRIN